MTAGSARTESAASSSPAVVVIDNYDSFTYNLVQYLQEIYDGRESAVQVFRNDAIDVERIAQLAPRGIVISPGPGDPTQAGVSNEVLRRFADSLPILGVCLGHQCLAHVLGGQV